MSTFLLLYYILSVVICLVQINILIYKIGRLIDFPKHFAVFLNFMMLIPFVRAYTLGMFYGVISVK